jgi:glycosyltransferase involved in cell wall biosynthesis
MIDVCLILEGTYPFVAGGVSTWVHQLITTMKDLRFSIVYISPLPDPHREYQYEIPPHVLDIKDIYLHSLPTDGDVSNLETRKKGLEIIQKVHESLMRGKWSHFAAIPRLFQDPHRTLTALDLFDSRESWQLLTFFYEQYASDISFLDFFYTWRSIYLPIFNIMRAPIPKAKLYHTVSTGYAGLFAAAAKVIQNKKMILTEHGIYTYERYLEIAQASWIYAPSEGWFHIEKELPFFKRLWLNLFQTFGSLTYHYADHILTLYEGNRQREILDGADAEKIRVIPNGVYIRQFQSIQHPPLNTQKPTIAFIGRVVSIKDVKTFLQAAHIVLSVIPSAQFLILGPLDEEPEYRDECLELTRSLGLEGKVDYKGKVNVHEYYSKIDLVVLTSLSEAQPYVILEANAVGIPIVATDVGACREMLEGQGLEDRELGLSGLLTQVANPEETAQAIVKLIKNPDLWNKFSEVGKTRVITYYDQNDLLSQYLNLYEQNLS